MTTRHCQGFPTFILRISCHRHAPPHNRRRWFHTGGDANDSLAVKPGARSSFFIKQATLLVLHTYIHTYGAERTHSEVVARALSHFSRL